MRSQQSFLLAMIQRTSFSKALIFHEKKTREGSHYRGTKEILISTINVTSFSLIFIQEFLFISEAISNTRTNCVFTNIRNLEVGLNKGRTPLFFNSGY